MGKLIGFLRWCVAMKKVKYFKGGVKSLGHTPIYKMHKYFARRPHNVFRDLIETYSKPNDVIWDCFGGGGVTLIEGLTADRGIISSDINPIASFIQYAQSIEIEEDRFRKLSLMIQTYVMDLIQEYYQTSCRHCNKNAHVRWYEHAYLVKCPECTHTTTLEANNKKIGAKNKPIDGVYVCQNCSYEIRAANVQRLGSVILNLKYKCGACGAHETVLPIAEDYEKFKEFEDQEDSWVSKYELNIPQDKIPAYWDRQKEDCLQRKGFIRFVDLFTPRNRVCSALYFKALLEIKNWCSMEEWQFMLFNISALLRYTNNMTFSVNSWMDGRPVAWSKHAYWTPNQFIECTPFEYFDNRIKASLSGIKDRNTRFSNKVFSFNPQDVIESKATHSVWNGSSSSMPLPDESIDLILTDPPYGSNVQYGELCHFWLVWTKQYLPFKTNLFELSDEVVVHRKKDNNSTYSKSFDDYKNGLFEVYKECYRVLKPEGILAFTFNNKNPSAWFSVMRAALDAGFNLEVDGITYQEQIDAYRDTAHLKYKGTAQGDFIYSFIKSDDVSKGTNQFIDLTYEESIHSALNDLKRFGTDFSEAQLFIYTYKHILIGLLPYIKDGLDESAMIKYFDFSNIIDYVKSLNIVLENEYGWSFKEASTEVV